MSGPSEPFGGVRCRVAGRVQGVWFRASTRDRAQQLGLTGYARNLRDGRVEVLACGAPEARAELCRWLHQGPPMARVDDLQCEEVACEPPPEQFTTG